MTITRSVLRFSVIGGLALSFSGAAFADSATLGGTTGPDSTNSVTTSNTWTNTVDNSNTVVILNASSQNSSTGAVSADGNTKVGNVASGAADNTNTTTTAVAIDNSGTGGLGGSTGGGSGSTGGSGNGTGGSGSATGGSGGSVLGASTGGMGSGSVATLPEVGASVPVDVSALRALYHAPVASVATPIPGRSNQRTFNVDAGSCRISKFARSSWHIPVQQSPRAIG